MNKSGDLRALANSESHKCFACGTANPYGLQMKFFADRDKTLYSWLTVPDHLCGWNNVVHGGVVATILDEIMGRAAIHFLKRFALTHSMNTQYLKPVNIGEEIRAEGRLVEIRGKREAEVEGFIFRGEKTLCAKAVGTFRLFSPGALSRLGVVDEQAVRGYEYLIQP